jgi:LmbE family N-acetylglucosaminyl deacetylase
MSCRAAGAVRSGVETVWRSMARAAGRRAGGTPAIWQSPGGQRVLVIAPHPDDEIACAGTLLLHRRAGDRVSVVHVTDGRRSRAGGLGPDAMAAQRRQEAAAVAPVLGLAGARWLGLREGEWPPADLVPLLAELLRDAPPDIVYAPSRVDFHPEHVRVAGCLARAFCTTALQQMTVRIYQIQVPLTPMLVNLVAQVTQTGGELETAMRCYRSQLGSIARCARMKRYAAAFYGRAGLVEEFWQLDVEGYRRLHGAPGTASFRGVRARPFTDPLSYLQGLRLRRRLRDLSSRG